MRLPHGGSPPGLTSAARWSAYARADLDGNGAFSWFTLEGYSRMMSLALADHRGEGRQGDHSSAAPTQGGCKAFGQNVAGLATALGPVFGATASTVATSGPGAFPRLVVHPEQAALCD